MLSFEVIVKYLLSRISIISLQWVYSLLQLEAKNSEKSCRIFGFWSLCKGMSAATKASTSFCLKSFFERGMKDWRAVFFFFFVIERRLLCFADDWWLNSEALVTVNCLAAENTKKIVIWVLHEFVWEFYCVGLGFVRLTQCNFRHLPLNVRCDLWLSC